MYKICFFVPEAHVEGVKDALFDKGAGQIGLYDRCSWQILGQGQFRALKGSQPFIGVQGRVELVSEYKVEMVCENHLIKEVVRELVDKHPYQEPAYEVLEIIDVGLF